MSRFMIGRVLAFGAFLLLLTAHPIAAQQQKEWTWKDGQGKLRTRADLDRILTEHQVWVESREKSGTQAGLRDADLTGANLTGALLVRAHLAGAHLNRADLNRAQLNRADLNGAYLDDANLVSADLHGADLGRATFEPKSIPELRGIAAAKNLELLTHEGNPAAMVQLRKQFEDGGFREQERKITYALKRREAELSWEGCKSRKLPEDKTRAILWSSDSNLANCGSFILNRVFFHWTCQYGMSPGRPLSLGVLLWL
jgi:hypothetical protein